MDLEILKNLLNLKMDDEKQFWIIFDWLKRDYLCWLKSRITSINWSGNWLDDLEIISNDTIEKWKHIESLLLLQENFPIKRLRGVLYEILFYLACIKASFIFKGSWILKLTSDSLKPEEKIPWMEIIPIYDVLPQTFRVKEGNKWVLKTPQIEADYIIHYWDDRGSSPLAFIDVKSNLNRYRCSNAIVNALGCLWFHNAIFEIAIPKVDYPTDLKDWEIKKVCWSCGSLNKEDAINCIKCVTKISIGFPYDETNVV